MAQMLTLNDRAILVQLENSEVYVLFEGRHYAGDEFVPPYIHTDVETWLLRRQAATARDFVAVCMAQKYRGVSEWPTLARKFLYVERPGAKAPAQWMSL